MFGDQNLFCRRNDFERVGGFSSSLPIMEDLDLLLRLHYAGPSQPVLERDTALVQDGQGSENGTQFSRNIVADLGDESSASNVAPRFCMPSQLHNHHIQKGLSNGPRRTKLGGSETDAVGSRDATREASRAKHDWAMNLGPISMTGKANFRPPSFPPNTATLPCI